MYEDEMLNELFNVEWKLWTENKDYGIYSRMSNRGLITIKTTGTVNCSQAELEFVLEDYHNRVKWDANFAEGGVTKVLGENCEIHYVRTRRVAVVSPRDCYTCIRKIVRDQSSGVVARFKRTKGKVLRSCMIACKSFELGDQYTPVQSGIVRILVYLTGYYIEEVLTDELDEHGNKKIVCDVIFFSEVDVKISQFIMRQLAPR